MYCWQLLCPVVVYQSWSMNAHKWTNEQMNERVVNFMGCEMHLLGKLFSWKSLFKSRVYSISGHLEFEVVQYTVLEITVQFNYINVIKNKLGVMILCVSELLTHGLTLLSHTNYLAHTDRTTEWTTWYLWQYEGRSHSKVS